jgi:DNA polymerase/3'-5' exonuclease PolX
MSTTATRMNQAKAKAIAARFVTEISPYCERIVVAGSIRRGAETVGDIEIVAVPKVEEVDLSRTLFDEVLTEPTDMLQVRLWDLLGAGRIERRVTNGHSAWGPRYRRLSFEGAPIDLFSCERERFGLILAIRTGPALYSQQLVTTKGSRTREGGRIGLCSSNRRVRDGWLTDRVSGQRIETPNEIDFYREIGQPFVAPKGRH